jgi:hypothetical protein
MGEDELERLFGQQMFNELAETAIEEMRSTGQSFDELFPSDVSDSEEKRKFRERIRKAVQINLLPIPSRGTVSSLRFE